MLLLVSPLGAVLGGLLVAVGFLHNPIGWRAFFLLAAIPLLVVTVARRHLHESQRIYLACSPSCRDTEEGPPVGRSSNPCDLAGTGAATCRGRRRDCISSGARSAAAIGWWTYYAEHERHISTSYRWGVLRRSGTRERRWIRTVWVPDGPDRSETDGHLYIVGAVTCAVTTFQVGNRWVMLPFLVGTAFFGIGVAPVLSAFATELFPTVVRAQASAWIRNGLGNTGSVLGPTIVGILGASAGPLGNIGTAVSVIALFFLLAVPIVWLAIAETRGRALESGE